ncbi:MAG: hypothetical protein K2V38_21665, partial [Gemmataceae bacterium]|nr:hypothetical protein [Gemmataceae bacterium]
ARLPARPEEPPSALGVVLGPFLGAAEWLFLPARLRPSGGHGLSVAERLATLARRPLVLLLALAIFIGLIVLAVR